MDNKSKRNTKQCISKKMLLSIAMLFILGIWFVPMNAIAQGGKGSPTSILDKASAKLKKSEGITVEFNMTNERGTQKGSLDMLDKKFHSTLDGYETWYDGTNLWTYLSNNQEVNLSEPSEEQLSKINPYYFLDMYKKGYSVSRGDDTPKYNEIVLTARKKKTSILKVVLRVSKTDNNLQYLKVFQPRNRFTEISVVSYKTGQVKNKKFTDNTFKFDQKKYPNADIIDLR